MKNNPHYLAISKFYGDKRAERSQVLLMNHIDEGLVILDAINASIRAKEAYCLHPIYQGLRDGQVPDPMVDELALNPVSIRLALEYRTTANAYLSPKYHSEDDVIELSVWNDVNAMLVADKVQNRKDFELYHKGTHPKSDRLDGYFKNWLRRLQVSEELYQTLCNKLPDAIER